MPHPSHYKRLYKDCITPEQKLAWKSRQLTKEQKAENSLHAKWRRDDNRRDKERKAELQISKANAKRELAILLFMEKTDVLDHHHSRTDSLLTRIIHNINTIKLSIKEGNPKHTEYDPYIWNHNSNGSSFMPISQLGCLWRGPFDTIYDVPLDGTYKFHTYDSGERGSGSFHRITADKVEVEVKAPFVSPGSLIPITVY